MSIKGIIIKSTGSWYQVLESESSKIFEARIRGKFKLKKTRLTNPLAVGDFVEFTLEKDDIAWITKIGPRKNYLIRKAVNLSKEAHIIASNIDIACILFTVKMPETSLGFLDRFLVCCEAYDIKPLILFNKIDLLNEEEKKYAEELSIIYKSIGYYSLFTSSIYHTSNEQLIDILKDKTSVFFGHSGSGKSTLINVLHPLANLKTGDISEIHLKGKHTTTFAQMYFWEFGGQVIDTPGVKEFAMVDVKKEEIQHFFPEIFSISDNCRFNNCLHINEPNCAVIAAVENYEILDSRYINYRKLMDEADEELK